MCGTNAIMYDSLKWCVTEWLNGFIILHCTLTYMLLHSWINWWGVTMCVFFTLTFITETRINVTVFNVYTSALKSWSPTILMPIYSLTVSHRVILFFVIFFDNILQFIVCVHHHFLFHILFRKPSSYSMPLGPILSLVRETFYQRNTWQYSNGL